MKQLKNLKLFRNFLLLALNPLGLSEGCILVSIVRSVLWIVSSSYHNSRVPTHFWILFLRLFQDFIFDKFRGLRAKTVRSFLAKMSLLLRGRARQKFEEEPNFKRTKTFQRWELPVMNRRQINLAAGENYKIKYCCRNTCF